MSWRQNNTYSSPLELHIPLEPLEKCTFKWNRDRHHRFGRPIKPYDPSTEPAPEHAYFWQVDQEKLDGLIRRLWEIADTALDTLQ